MSSLQQRPQKAQNHLFTSLSSIKPMTLLWLVVLLLSETVLLVSAQSQAQDGAGIDLGGGIVTKTNVQSFADLSQDVREIANLLTSGQVGEAKGVYRSGLHSEIIPGVKRALATLGDNLSANTPKTPFFLYHLFGQTGPSDGFNFALDASKTGYINNYVLKIMDESPTLAIEAIIAVNVFMYATDLLYTGVYTCYRHSLAENPAIFNVGTAGWDEFIALYIGSGQTPAQTTGSSLYAWAQTLGDTLSTSDPEAPVNTKIKLLYQQAITMVSIENACTSTSSADTPGELWKLTVSAVAELSKPLFQGLFHALTSKNRELVGIYAFALIPQISKCRPSLFKRLHQALLSGDELNLDDSSFVNAILADIPEATSCFGYSCGDLGSTNIAVCSNDFETYLSYAGYVPSTSVRAVGMADLDIHQMKILLELQASQFAEFLYMHGSNIAKFGQDPNDPVQYVSLHDIAVTSERNSASPWFEAFVNYNNNEFYADDVIRAALDTSNADNKWKSTDQIVEIVTTTAAYQILLLEGVSKLKIAVSECRDADPEQGPDFALDPIDEAAALIVGSMEGPLLGGSSDLEDGQLIYNINNRHAFQFGTFTDGGNHYSKSVSVIEDLLFAAKAQLDALDCDNLEATTESILKHSMVGIAQGAILLADKNAGLKTISTAGGLAKAEGLALSIIPLIAANKSLKSVTDTLTKNLIWTPGSQPVPDGSQVTASAMGNGFSRALGLNCRSLGSIQNVDPCDGAGSAAVATRATFVSMTLATSAALLVSLMMIFG